MPTKTKSEIFDNHYDYASMENMPQDSVFKAMDEWSKIQSIGFIEWIASNQSMVPRIEDGKIEWYYVDNGQPYKSNTEHVYQMYLQSKTK